MTAMRDTFDPIDEDDVRAFERVLGHPLPAGYRRFLLQHNGGKPANDEFEVPGRSPTGVQYFFGLDADHGYDLRWNLDVMADDLPAGVIPIGTDSGGNIVCLGIAGDRHDQVYFWIHDEAFRLILLATTFDGFVNGLAPDGTYS